MSDSFKSTIMDSLHYLASINHYVEMHHLGEISDKSLIETIKRRKEDYGHAANPRHTANIMRLLSDMTIESPSKEEFSPFKSEADELIYYLLELDGTSRIQKLDITPYHYQNKEYAGKWKDGIYQKISPFVSNHPLCEKALEELNRLYKSMIKNSK